MDEWVDSSTGHKKNCLHLFYFLFLYIIHLSNGQIKHMIHTEEYYGALWSTLECPRGDIDIQGWPPAALNNI